MEKIAIVDIELALEYLKSRGFARVKGEMDSLYVFEIESVFSELKSGNFREWLNGIQDSEYLPTQKRIDYWLSQYRFLMTEILRTNDMSYKVALRIEAKTAIDRLKELTQST